MGQVDKKEAAKVMRRIGVLLELKGENPFKSRAYGNAARVIEGYEGSMDELVPLALDGKIKGIGKAIAPKLSILAENGELSYLVELEASFPEGLLQILHVQGLGPKKVKRLYDELGISSLTELEYACHENRLVELSGFGPKSQTNILKGIEHLKKFAGRFHFHLAKKNAVELLERIEKAGKPDSIQICGSLRRGKETIKDIDILAAAGDSELLMDTFVNDPEVERVTGHGKTKSSIILKSGLSADIRVVEKAAYPSALHHFTGSKEHNTLMRSLAKKRGMKLSEYGLFKGDTPLEIKTEADIFKHLDLAYIPPEIREGAGELEAAADGSLPELVSEGDIRGVIHIHTTYSDGTETVANMATGCREAGYEYLGVTDHSRTAVYAGGLTDDDLMKQRAEIDALNEKLTGFTVFAGVESDVLADGFLDYDDDMLSELDFVIASIHSGFTGSKDETTARLIKAIEHPATRILGHPTGRLILGREGYKVDMAKIIDACAANKVSIELNANPYRLDIDWRLIRDAIRKGVKICINPDAHSIKQIRFIKLGVIMARKGWCEKTDILNARDAQGFRRFLESGE